MGWSEPQTAIEDQQIGSPSWLEMQANCYLRIRDKVAKPFWDTAFELASNEQFSGFQINAAQTAYGLVEVQPPRVFGLVQQIESQVVANRPEFVVDPMKARSEDFAMWGSTLINADWQRTKAMMSETRMATRNCILTGWGPMLSGLETDYDAARRDRKRRDNIAKQIQDSPLLGEIQANLLAEQAQGKDSVDEPERDPTYEGTNLSWRGRVFSRAISPFQFLVDPNASSLDDAEWCGRIIIARLDWVKANKDFSNKSKLKGSAVLSGSAEARAAMSPNQFGRIGKEYAAQDDVQRVQLFEIYCKQEDGSWDKCVFAKGQKKPLQVVENCYDIGNPYRLLRWNHLSNRIFATSDVQAVMSQVIEERELRTRLHDAFMRSAVDNYIGSKTLFGDDADIHPLVVPGVGQIITLENLPPGVSPDQAITLMKRNGQMQESIAYLQILDREFNIATGLGNNQNSQALKSETSATEAAEIAKASGSRGRSKYAFCEEFASGVATDRLGLICQFYDEVDIAALAGPDAAAFWLKEMFTPGDIQAGLSVRVEEGTMQPKDNASVAATLKDLFMACITPPTAPIANVYINAGETFGEMIRRMGIPKGSKIVNEVTPQMTQAVNAMLMQMGMAQAGIMPQTQTGNPQGGPPDQGPPPQGAPQGRAKAAQKSGSKQ